MRLIAAILTTMMLCIIAGCRQSEEKSTTPAATATATATPVPSPTPEPPPVDLGDGLVYKVLRDGSGDVVTSGSLARLRMDIADTKGAALWSGTFEFLLGSGQAYPGLDRGIVNMRMGERRRIDIPAPLAFRPDMDSAAVDQVATVELIALPTPSPTPSW